MVDMINIDRSLAWASELLYAKNSLLCNSLSHLVVGVGHRYIYPIYIDKEYDEVVTWR